MTVDPNAFGSSRFASPALRQSKTSYAGQTRPPFFIVSCGGLLAVRHYPYPMCYAAGLSQIIMLSIFPGCSIPPSREMHCPTRDSVQTCLCDCRRISLFWCWGFSSGDSVVQIPHLTVTLHETSALHPYCLTCSDLCPSFSHRSFFGPCAISFKIDLEHVEIASHCGA